MPGLGFRFAQRRGFRMHELHGMAANSAFTAILEVDLNQVAAVQFFE